MYKGTNMFWQKLRKGETSGQVVAFAVLIIALIFLFVLITRNVGQYSHMRTAVANAADGATLGLISNMGSYATHLSKSYLEWTDEQCTWNWFKILEWVIDIVIIIVTWGTATPFVIAGTLMHQGYSYTEAAQMASAVNTQFKKMGKKLQFKTSARIDGLSRLVTDQRKVTDVHDWDHDGLTDDKIPAFQSWLQNRLLVDTMADRGDMIRALQRLIKLFAGLNFEGLNGEDYDCRDDTSCGLVGYHDNELPGAELYSNIYRKGQPMRKFFVEGESWNPSSIGIKGWIKEPGGLFEAIEEVSAPEVGPFDLSFWQPGENNDDIDRAIVQFQAFYAWAKNHVMDLLESPVDHYDWFNEEWEFYSAARIVTEVDNCFGCDSWYSVTDGRIYPHAANIMNNLYVPYLYELDPETNDPILFDEEGNPVPPIIDWYDRAAGYQNEVTGDVYPGWLENFTAWRDELRQIYMSLPETIADNTYCALTCEAEPESPECAQCEDLVNLRQRFNDEQVFGKFAKMIEYIGAFIDVIFNNSGGSKRGLANIWIPLEQSDDYSEYIYSWPTKIKGYSWLGEDLDEDGYKTLWYHMRVKITNFPSKIPYIKYDSNWLGMEECYYLRKAKEYVGVKVQFYAPDIPIYYTRGGRAHELLWKIRRRKQVENSINDEFATLDPETDDINGDGVIGFEDLPAASQTRVRELLNDYGISARAKGLFNWRMYKNYLSNIYE